MKASKKENIRVGLHRCKIKLNTGLCRALKRTGYQLRFLTFASKIDTTLKN